MPCVGVLVGTTLGGRLATRTGLRTTMVTGQVIGLFGVAGFAALVDDGSPWPLVFGLALLFSLGQGVVFTTMFATATTGIDESGQGYAGGVATAGQQIGGAIGLAVLINLTTAAAGPTLTVAMTGIAAIIVLGLIVAFAVPGRAALRRQHRE
ncbi:MFS transporter [Brevibacterium sp. 2SA]|uniref:MFS transporter n=1 Tax=Brevibacterium sp. 2SA TaxID=2502198 RepID=UPI0032C47AD6